MSAAARLIVCGLVLVVGAVIAYAFFDWTQFFERYPHYLRPLKRVLRHALDTAWYVALGLPVVLVLGSAYQLVVAKSGRGMIVAKLFAWFTLWVIGSFAFYFALFLTYAPGMRQGGTELAAPALLAILGYMVIGLGFAAAVLRKP